MFKLQGLPIENHTNTVLGQFKALGKYALRFVFS